MSDVSASSSATGPAERVQAVPSTATPASTPKAAEKPAAIGIDAGRLSQMLPGNFTASDLAVAAGVVAILAVLIIPMPAWILDFSLAISITFSVLVLMTCLFIRSPLEFSVFPTILLMATMLRLALNLASTRLILSDGHQGTDAAGAIIQSFGNFVMSGNFVIGIIVFSILVIVNFVVITKGSTRIAEVAARFTLDAMPGKQMAIDADLSSGLIGEDEARQRRQRLEDESSFFGAMDGASKFVRGDAVAGILITLINIIGGIIIGVAQNDMDFANAADTYTLLTVGDGLVSQIPALIVSVAAGLLVSKSGSNDASNEVIFKQLSSYPNALGFSAMLLLALGIVPGMPTLPFLVLGGGVGYAAWHMYKKQQHQEESQQQQEEEAESETKRLKDEPISTALALDDLRLELGYGLLPLISENGSFRLTDQIKALRRQIASDMGFVMPAVRILDNMQLPSNDYVVRVKEVESGRGTLNVSKLLVMDPRGKAPQDIPGDATKEPAFGLPALWIEQQQREEASFRGYTVVDPATVVTTHLTEIIKQNMAELLSYGATQSLLDELPPAHKKLLDDLVPAQMSVTTIQRILQRLLNEQISIRDLPTVVEGLAEAASQNLDLLLMGEHVRSRLSRQISHQYTSPSGYVPLVTLSPVWEQRFQESIHGSGENRQLAMDPGQLQEFIQVVRDKLDELAQQGEAPVLLTSAHIRPYVRSIVERFRPATAVLAQTEIHPQAKIRTLAQI